MSRIMTGRPRLRATLLASVLALTAGAPPALAGTTEWLAGPLTLVAGQTAQVSINNTDAIPCAIVMQLRAGQPGTANSSGVFQTESVAKIVSPDIVLGVSKTLIVSYPNPNNERLQVTTRVQARCPFPFSGQHVSVMLEIVDTATLQTTVALQATVQSSKR